MGALDDDSALPDALRTTPFVRGDIYDAPDWYDVDYAGYRAEEQFYRLVKARALPESGTIVELGAGTGRLTFALVDSATRIHAVEPARAMRESLAASSPRNPEGDAREAGSVEP